MKRTLAAIVLTAAVALAQGATKTVSVPVQLSETQQAQVKKIRSEYKVKRSALTRQARELRDAEAKAIAEVLTPTKSK